MLMDHMDDIQDLQYELIQEIAIGDEVEHILDDRDVRGEVRYQREHVLVLERQIASLQGDRTTRDAKRASLMESIERG